MCFSPVGSGPERVPAEADAGHGGAPRARGGRLPEHGGPAGGRNRHHEGRDGAPPEGVPGPAERQDGAGRGDRHLQEAAGRRGEQVRTRTEPPEPPEPPNSNHCLFQDCPADAELLHTELQRYVAPAGP